MKILLNGCYGGFGYSKKFVQFAKKQLGKDCDFSIDNQTIVELAETYGLKKASDEYANLYVAHVPDGLKYSIHEYDGIESIQATWLEVPKADLIKGLSMEQMELAKKADYISITYPEK